jgi:hypothetical protein
MARLRKLPLRPVATAAMLFDLWQRLSPKQRKQLLSMARRHGPKVAAKASELGRTVRARRRQSK